MNTTASRIVHFDLETGLAPPDSRASLKRRLSDMKGMYADETAFAECVAAGDPVVYEFYDMGVPETPLEVAYGTSIVYPGKVGEEFHMTKGHFHTVLESAEVYFCIRGRGLMLMENPEGDVEVQEMKPGSAVYVPGRFAHRSVNVDPHETLVTFFSFRADAGHDYGTIETRGYRKLVVARGGTWTLVDNPRWQES